MRAFSLLAIVTSTIGFVYGLVDFFADIFDSALEGGSGGGGAGGAGGAEGGGGGGGGASSALAAGGALRQAALFGLTLLPPLLVAESGGQELFFSALDYAGAFGILSLFGIIPAAMAWQQRYAPGAVSVAPPALPGGRASLVGMSVVAAAIIGLEVQEKLLPLFFGVS